MTARVDTARQGRSAPSTVVEHRRAMVSTPYEASRLVRDNKLSRNDDSSSKRAKHEIKVGNVQDKCKICVEDSVVTKERLKLAMRAIRKGTCIPVRYTATAYYTCVKILLILFRSRRCSFTFSVAMNCPDKHIDTSCTAVYYT